MRALRRPVAGLLLAVGLTGAAVAIEAPPGFAARTTSLVVSPDRGSANTQLTVTYRWPSATTRKRPGTHACTPEQITFEWDGSPLGRAAATTTGNTCVAVLRVAPPAGTRQGTHTITVDNDSSLRATYTVAERSPSAGTPSSATPESRTDAAIDPQATDLADTSAPSPHTTGQTGLADGGQRADHGGSTWYISFGVILFLAGAATFGLIVWRTRRAKSEGDAVWSATAGDTQALPLRARTAWRPAHRRSG